MDVRVGIFRQVQAQVIASSVQMTDRGGEISIKRFMLSEWLTENGNETSKIGGLREWMEACGWRE